MASGPFGVACLVVLALCVQLAHAQDFGEGPPPRSADAHVDTPFISQVSPSNGPTTGGTIMTIMGKNFGHDNNALIVKIAGENCKNVVLTKPTEVLCETPAGVGGQNIVSVQVVVSGVSHSNPPTDQAHFMYDPPTVEAVRPGHGPTLGETVITIVGNNFGATDVKPLAKIGGRRCLDTIWLSNTKLTCVTPKGMGIGDVRVFVEGQASPEGFGTIYEFDPPSVSSVAPLHGPTSGHILVTAFGKNFGPTDSHPEITIGAQPCDQSTWVSDSCVLCELPSGMGADKNVVVMVLGEGSKVTDVSKFTYDGPTVSSIHPENGPTSGATALTIFGVNFGHTDNEPIALVGGKLCSTVHWTSDSSIRCLTPAGLGNGNDVEVRVAGAASEKGNVEMQFSYDAPSVASVVPHHGPATGGFSITITGDNFGTHMGAITGFVGETMCAQTKWVSNTGAQCVVPPGVGGEIVVHVKVGDQDGSNAGNGKSAFSYNAPTISKISPSHGQPDGGQLVTVHGLNFGLDKKKVHALLGDQACTVLHANNDRVVIATPKGTGSEQLSLVVAGQTSKDHPYFAFSGPRIHELSRVNGPTMGGTMLTVIGTGFEDGDGFSVQIGGLDCLSSTWVSQSAATCVSPPGSGGGLPVAIKAKGKVEIATGSAAGFSYDVPVIESVAPGSGSAHGGTKVLLMGRNFGFVDSDPVIRIGSTRCTESKWTSDRGAVCITPAASPGVTTAPVSVEVTGQTGSGADAVFRYDAAPTRAAIGELRPDHASPSGGEVLEITGSGFEAPPVDARLIISVGATECDVSTYVSASAISCVIPPGVGAGEVVTVALGTDVVASGASTDKYFSYDAPTVTAVAPRSGPLEGGNMVTIMGNNFGPDGTHPFVKLGMTACESVSYVSETAVLCQSPAGEGVNQGVEVEVGRQSSPVDTYGDQGKYSFEGLSVDSVFPGHAPTGGGVDVTFHAASFGSPPDDTTTMRMTINDLPCNGTQWISEQQLACRVPAGVGDELNVVVRIEDEVWRGFGLFSYDAPSIKAVVPSSGPLFGGIAITVEGQNFGVSDSDPSVWVAGAECSKTYYQGDSTLICVLPPYKGNGNVSETLVRADVGGQMTPPFLAALFEYDGAMVTGVEPKTGPVTGETTVTITGVGFGATDTSPVAYVGETPCQDTRWLSDAKVACVTPKASDLYVPHQVWVSVLNHTSVIEAGASANFSYADMRAWAPSMSSRFFGPDGIQGSQRHGTLYLTVAYLVALVFIITSLICGRCLFSGGGDRRQGVPGGGGIMARLRAVVTKTVARVKAMVFKTSGVYQANQPGGWGDYSAVQSIEMEPPESHASSDDGLSV